MFQFKCLYIGISLVVEERRLKTDSIIQASIPSTCFAMFEEANVKSSFYKQAFLSQSTVCLPGNVQSRLLQCWQQTVDLNYHSSPTSSKNLPFSSGWENKRRNAAPYLLPAKSEICSACSPTGSSASSAVPFSRCGKDWALGMLDPAQPQLVLIHETLLPSLLQSGSFVPSGSPGAQDINAFSTRRTQYCSCRTQTLLALGSFVPV